MTNHKESDLKRAFSEDGELKTHVGGQALIEGVMMRGKYNWAVAVREPQQTMYTEEHELSSGKKKNSWMYWPLVRGCRAFVESLMLGYKALESAALHAYGEEVEDEAEGESEEAFGKKEMILSLVFGLVLGIGLLIVLPAVVANVLVGEYDDATLTWNIVDGLVRVAIFVFYIWLIGRMEDIKRMFGYHGAEHKTISCYESGDELTVENVRKHTRFHPRCGTSFLLVVMILSIVLFSAASSLLLTWVPALESIHGTFLYNLIMIVFKLLLLPLVVSISYEFHRFAGRHDNWFTRILVAPGLWFQRFTTREPDDSMIEVGITAFKAVLPAEEGADRW